MFGSERRERVRSVLAYLVKAQIVLDGVRRVEDGPAGSDDEDKAVERLRGDRKMHKRSKYGVQKGQQRHTLYACVAHVSAQQDELLLD